MVGVIGTAPASGTVYTADPGPQGSNLDCNAIRVGSRVHLPVNVAGALLCIGDVHASMGDGEVSGTGVEINAEVQVRVENLPCGGHGWPWIETADEVVAVGHRAQPPQRLLRHPHRHRGVRRQQLAQLGDPLLGAVHDLGREADRQRLLGGDPVRLGTMVTAKEVVVHPGRAGPAPGHAHRGISQSGRLRAAAL